MQSLFGTPLRKSCPNYIITEDTGVIVTIVSLQSLKHSIKCWCLSSNVFEYPRLYWTKRMCQKIYLMSIFQGQSSNNLWKMQTGLGCELGINGYKKKNHLMNSCHLYAVNLGYMWMRDAFYRDRHSYSRRVFLLYLYYAI